MNAVASSHVLPTPQQTARVAPAQAPRGTGTGPASSTPDLPPRLHAAAARYGAVLTHTQRSDRSTCTGACRKPIVRLGCLDHHIASGWSATPR